MKVDYIIVGLGLAGLALVEELKKINKTFLVFEDDSQTSSLVAGGTYNPVILKRFTPVWNGHEQLLTAMPFYERLEKRFEQQFDTKFATKKVFGSVADQNNWFTALDKPTLSYYMKSNISKEKIPGVIGNLGFGELKGTGRVDTTKLVSVYRNSLKEEEVLRQEKFDYSKLKITKNILEYQTLQASYIVFCEGFGLKQNPFFNYLPLNGTKGETITIHAPDLKIDFLLKSSVFILPLGDDMYKVGATFNWDDKTSIPTKEGKQELEEKLRKVITVPYKIMAQAAGIRPTVKDRRPLVGTHPEYNNLAVLNGLGTRGVMIAPTVAKQLVNHLENKEILDAEININRF